MHGPAEPTPRQHVSSRFPATPANPRRVRTPMSTYSRLIGTSHPGLIMMLLDQSSSMADNQKAQKASTAVNRGIYEIMLARRAREKIQERRYVGLIGLGA